MPDERPAYETDTRTLSTQEKRAVSRILRAVRSIRGRGKLYRVGAGSWKYLSIGYGTGDNFPCTVAGAIAAAGKLGVQIEDTGNWYFLYRWH